jgi:hypothetical protein
VLNAIRAQATDAPQDGTHPATNVDVDVDVGERDAQPTPGFTNDGFIYHGAGDMASAIPQAGPPEGFYSQADPAPGSHLPSGYAPSYFHQPGPAPGWNTQSEPNSEFIPLAGPVPVADPSESFFYPQLGPTIRVPQAEPGAWSYPQVVPGTGLYHQAEPSRRMFVFWEPLQHRYTPPPAQTAEEFHGVVHRTSYFVPPALEQFAQTAQDQFLPPEQDL